MADATNRSANATHPQDGVPSNGRLQSPKRIRACISCRNMKIKCIYVPGSNDCESCLRSSRPCQDPGPPKARVKTSQKFTELEKKIDALTSALDAERRRNRQSEKSLKQPSTGMEWSRTPDSNAKDDHVFSPTAQQGPELDDAMNDGRGAITTGGDVVGQGLIDMPTASLLFDHWMSRMRPFMPVIKFSAEDDAQSIRWKRPTLFLTIITIAATAIRPSIVPRLLTRLNNNLAQDVFIQGAKSLDLLQSMVLFSHYYIQPPHIKAFAMPQHAYSAAVMSHDLGLAANDGRDESNSMKTKETCRTLLAVYLGASCAATLLRRHQPLVSTPMHRDYIEALSRDHDEDPDDQWLCSLVSLQELFDDASRTLNVSYSGADESFDDFKTQHLLNTFRQRLNDWKQSRSGKIDQRLKTHAASVADLYIHQVAIRAYNVQMLPWVRNKEENGPARPEPEFTAAHTNALCHCLKVSADIINTYLSLDDTTLRSLPNIFLVWNMCAAICLIKLGYFAEKISSSRTSSDSLSDPPSPLHLIQAMIQKLSVLSREGYFPQSRPFAVAFKKLQLWFVQKKAICVQRNGGCYNDGSGPIHYLLGTQTPPASPSAKEVDVYESCQQHAPNAATSHESQPTAQQDLGWNINPFISEQSRIQADETTLTNNALGMAYDTDYSYTSLADFGFDFNDIDRFMSQMDDDGLGYLL
ncbi:hypothetical protein GGR52DRAFT_365968 [Hypoxylon sp. FL1284]|nr:hypothetical protein GGR52DRAFT_365968 [Hypoxylon sp. FL1284]